MQNLRLTYKSLMVREIPRKMRALFLLRHVRREVVVRVINMHKCAVDIRYAFYNFVSMIFLKEFAEGIDLPRTYCKLSPRS